MLRTRSASPQSPRLFISYARLDGARLAQRLQSSLENEGFDTWLDVQRLQGGAAWSVEIEREIDTRPVTIALLSPGSYGSEICRAEQLRALDKGNRVIPILAVKGAERPLCLYARQYRDFTNEANYLKRIRELITDIHGDVTAALPEIYTRTKVTYLTAPPRVANYIERTKEVSALRDALFAEDHRQPIALTALAGMGGIGKTVLAKAVAEDVVIQRAFPDGIVWITAGQERERNFLDEMREVAKALGDDLTRYDTALACEHQYRTTIANKAALIVVDDVWSKSDIEPLLAESPRSRFLFTTRDASIGKFVGAREHSIDLLDAGQSRELLASWANISIAELPSVADDIINECGRLPLAVSVIGAILRRPVNEAPATSIDVFWKDTLDLLRTADISSIEEQLPEGQQSFYKTIEVSFRRLTPIMQDRYKVLALLLEDMRAPVPILQALWGLSEPETRRTRNHFVDRSLAQPDDVGQGIRLHDLQLDYARAQYADNQALDLIHGAILLSSHIIEDDPLQFPSQMLGRLLPIRHPVAIQQFTDTLTADNQTPGVVPIRGGLIPPGGPLQKTFSGRGDYINSLSLTADGTLALSGHEEYDKPYTLKLWDVSKGRLLKTYEGQSFHLSAVAISPNGTDALVAVGDTIYRLPPSTDIRAIIRWDLQLGQPVRVYRGHRSRINDLAVDSKWNLAVSGGEDGTLRIWKLTSGSRGKLVKHPLWRTLPKGPFKTFPYPGPLPPVFTAVVFLPDDRHVLAASKEEIYLLDTTTRLLTHLLDATAEVVAMAVSQSGVLLIASGGDTGGAYQDPTGSTIEIWDLPGKYLKHSCAGHSALITSVTVSADGRSGASSSFDNTIRIWDIVNGIETCVLRGHSTVVSCVKLSKDGIHAISAGGRPISGYEHENALKIWNLHRSEIRDSDHDGSVTSVVCIPNTQSALSGTETGTLYLWDLSNGKKLSSCGGHIGGVSKLISSRDGRYVISGGEGKKIKAWDPITLREIFVLEGHSRAIRDLAVDDSTTCLISVADGDKNARVWDFNRKRCCFELGQEDAYAITISPDGRHGVWRWQHDRDTIIDERVGIWDLLTGELFHELKTPVDILRFFPDGRRLIGYKHGMIEIWNAATWEKEQQVKWESSGGRLSPDILSVSGEGRYIVAADSHSITAWDIRLNEIWRTDLRVDYLVCGRHNSLATASRDGTIRIWDVEGMNQRSMFTADYGITSCDLSYDGKTVVAGDMGGNIHILNLRIG
jgi:WD40 repeat protein